MKTVSIQIEKNLGDMVGKSVTYGIEAAKIVGIVESYDPTSGVAKVTIDEGFGTKLDNMLYS
jgi:hypothetical protein